MVGLAQKTNVKDLTPPMNRRDFERKVTLEWNKIAECGNKLGDMGGCSYGPDRVWAEITCKDLACEKKDFASYCVKKIAPISRELESIGFATAYSVNGDIVEFSARR